MLAQATGTWEATKAPGAHPEGSEYNHRLPALPLTLGKEENLVKAIVRDTYGPSEVLELREIDKPEIGDEEVLLRVHAAGVDRGVWHIMTGLAYPIRLAGYGLRAPKNPVIGMDLARSEEHTSELQSRQYPACRLLLEKKNIIIYIASVLAEHVAEIGT